MYKLQYLPAAKRDLVEIVQYIAHELHDSQAAERLAVELVEAAERVARFPYLYAGYIPIRPLKHEYRRVVVHNYAMFYRVDEMKQEVIIVRVLYLKRNLEHLL